MDYYIGTIQAFPYGFEPRGWVLCDGRSIQIYSNTALFSLIGFSYGGNGQTTFMLPNLVGADPCPDVKYYIAVNGFSPMRPY